MEQNATAEFTLHTPITVTNVRAFEQYYATKATPMRPESDRLVMEYFQFMENQLLAVDDPTSLTYPLPFYDGEIQNQKALKRAVLTMVRSYRHMMLARGRNDMGMIKPNSEWWSNQNVIGLYEIYCTLGTHLGQVVTTLGISDEQFWDAIQGE